MISGYMSGITEDINLLNMVDCAAPISPIVVSRRDIIMAYKVLHGLTNNETGLSILDKNPLYIRAI